jgi:hypothetical protein
VLGWRSRRRLCRMSLRDKNNVYLLQIGGLHPFIHPLQRPGNTAHFFSQWGSGLHRPVPPHQN